LDDRTRFEECKEEKIGNKWQAGFRSTIPTVKGFSLNYNFAFFLLPTFTASASATTRKNFG